MKLRNLIIGIVIAVILLGGAFSAGLITGRLASPTSGRTLSLDTGLPAIAGAIDAPGDTNKPEDLDALFVPFWQAWDLVHEQYVEQPIDNETLMRGAIRGMSDSLGDPHSTYLDPEEYQMLNTQLQGEETYEGIGAWVDTTGEYLMIISPIPDSPAEGAGLRTGDRIIAIDGEDMTGVDGEVVRKQVLGPAGTTVKLTISREGVEPFDVDIVRASITVPSVESKMMDNDIGYIRLFIFSGTATDELRVHLKELLAQEPVGLILDLRGNGGGFLDTAVDVASEFIPEGVIVYEEYGDGSRTELDAKKGGLATDIPIVVLINEGSASASEIVAGAIQDRLRGPLIGAQSFGKGSVQLPTTLADGQGAVRITIARWLTPNSRSIHGVGLTPDYGVEITDEDIAAERDPQLDRAVEILLETVP